MLKSKQDAS